MMDHDRCVELLNDFVDGRLEAQLEAEVEAHVGQCADCERGVAALRSLLADTGRLPRSIEPPRDLWPGVERRLSARHRRRPRLWRPRYAVAAVALLAIALSLTQVRTKRAREAAVSPVATGQPVAGLVSVTDQWRRTEETYERAAAELQSALDVVRTQLDPETVQRVEDNLRIIDAAIRESREALAADPGNIEVLQLLAAVHEKKIELLQQATRYPRL